MKGLQEFPRMNALPLGSLHKRGQNAMRFNSRIRPRPEAYLPENNHMPKRLLRVIIRGRHAGNAQEGK